MADSHLAAVTGTRVLFSHGITSTSSQVLRLVSTDSGLFVVVDVTPFHPVSHIWPDHPADRGYIEVCGQRLQVLDCLTGGYDEVNQQLYIDRDIPVKRGEPGWHFVVVHQLAPNADLAVGDKITMQVDVDYQLALSRGHSAGHLASFALNKVLEQGYWRKDADRKDALNNRDFHSYAQTCSVVSENMSTDDYRLGKTLNKRGLNVADVVADVELITAKVNKVLADWLTTRADVVLRCDGDKLTDSRYWRCDLGAGESISMPCGGTHVQNLAQFNKIEINLSIKSA